MPILGILGIDLSDHVFQPVTRELADAADLIIVADEKVRTERPYALLRRFPHVAARTVLASELVGRDEDIPDFGGVSDAVIHLRALAMITDYIERGFPTIRRRLGF